MRINTGVRNTDLRRGREGLTDDGLPRKGDGFYLAFGTYHASRQDIWHASDDFSRPPELFMKAIPLNPLKEEVAKIRNRLVSKKERLDSLVETARLRTKPTSASSSRATVLCSDAGICSLGTRSPSSTLSRKTHGAIGHS